MANNEVLNCIFFDIEKAYDMMWKDDLLMKMGKTGIKRRMINWVMDFMMDHTVQVRVGSSHSKVVCSPILFIIMVNYIFSKVGTGIGKSLYADDRELWKRGKNAGGC